MPQGTPRAALLATLVLLGACAAWGLTPGALPLPGGTLPGNNTPTPGIPGPPLPGKGPSSRRVLTSAEPHSSNSSSNSGVDSGVSDSTSSSDGDGSSNSSSSRGTSVGNRSSIDASSNTSGSSIECRGRRVFLLDLGEQFHTALLTAPSGGDTWHQRASAVNAGFGPERGFIKLAGSRRKALGDATLAEAGALQAAGDRWTEGERGPGTTGGKTSERKREVDDKGDATAWPDLPLTWFDTWANALDVVFHQRMLTYPCRVSAHADADLVFVPYYGSLDISVHVWQSSEQRGRLGRELSARLLAHPVYQSRQGRGVFVVLGRPYWDFIANLSDPGAVWGTDSMRLEGLRQAQTVTVERPYWVNNTVGAPYPMAFHPPGSRELRQWTEFVRAQPRPWLFVFAGARRRAAKEHQIQAAVAVRNSVFWQCAESSRCRLIDCESPLGRCEHDWRTFTQLYLSSTFCVHPRGDSCTRRAVLDSMLAGCIPVVLEPCTLQWQYEWLVGPAEDVSVLIDGDKLRQEGSAEASGGVLLEEALGGIPAEKVEAMRGRILDLVPKFSFGGRMSSPSLPGESSSVQPPDFEDSFVAIIDKVVANVRGATRQS